MERAYAVAISKDETFQEPKEGAWKGHNYPLESSSLKPYELNPLYLSQSFHGITLIL